MALSRIRSSKDLPTVLSRINHQVTGSSLESRVAQRALEGSKTAGPVKKAGLHVSGVRRYPAAPRLPLPSNVSEIFANETGRFTPERVRDIAAPVLFYVAGPGNRDARATRNFQGNCGGWGPVGAKSDDHVDSYDCFGAVSLNSSMQSNVPHPFCSSGKSSHFNMPGGQWTTDSKYIAEDMQKSHYTNSKSRDPVRKGFANGRSTNVILARLTSIRLAGQVEYSTDGRATTRDGENVSKAQKLKHAVKVYGSTVVVFHVGLSLLSLGICYAAVSSGLDAENFVKAIPFSGGEGFDSVVANSSTFLIAYAVHKVLAPVRISITLAAIPFFVRYFQRIGIMRKFKS